MKTELEWVNIDSGNLPEKNRELLLVIESENTAGSMEDYLMIGEMQKNLNGENHFDITHGRPISFFEPHFENDGKKIIKWAYVNLPEEEDKLYISEIKIPVNCTVNFDKSIPGTDKTVTTLANKEKETIRRSHEFRNYPLDDEGWIWPLKQLPEDGQEVEVKHLDGEENKTFFIGKTFRGGKYIAAPPYYIDVIAWRPLKEEKVKPKEYEPYPALVCTRCKKTYGFLHRGEEYLCEKCRDLEPEAKNIEDRNYESDDMKKFTTIDKWNDCCDAYNPPYLNNPPLGIAIDLKFRDGGITYNAILINFEWEKPNNYTLTNSGKTFDWCKYKDIIQWRFNKRQEPEARKPDFSKLRKQDNLIISYDSGAKRICTLSGFFKNIDSEYLIFSTCKSLDCEDESLNERVEIKGIKKIIRINIDSPTSIVNSQDGLELKLPFRCYPFEEI